MRTVVRSARARYNWHRRGGLSPQDAEDAVAIEMGLATTVVRLTGKKRDELVPAHWTVEQMTRLEVLKEQRERGLVGGPEK